MLTRFFTVGSAVATRKSVAHATVIESVCYPLLFITDFEALPVLRSAESDLPKVNGLGSGADMVALYLARGPGGDVLFGLLPAVNFATNLAVMAGLKLVYDA